MFTSDLQEKYVPFFTETLSAFGGEIRGKSRYVLRKNIGSPFPESGAYFGCISDAEDPSGPYSDLSIVVFPSNENNATDDRWIIALGVGSLGYKNDYHLASIPGTRRLFAKHLGKDSFIKTDFLDIESQIGFSGFCDKNDIPVTLNNAVKNYGKVLLVCSLLDPNDYEQSQTVIRSYLAIYSLLRDWPNKAQKKSIDKVLSKRIDVIDEKEEIMELLKLRRYLVLQGAPGTGKTRMAKGLVVDTPKENVFFTQFHAETSYSDFVYGIIPNTEANELKYSERKGVFVKAIEKANEVLQHDSTEKVFLIIDEINRANLSNVLGTAFYLFEPTMGDSNIEIEVCPGLSLAKLPDNLYVIATMNTADRSLAVVDFALRRRFAWYTMYPKAIQADSGMHFCNDEYRAIADIFERYATDEELNLQPGQAYFIVSEDHAEYQMKNRMKYEIMPLIKEYLADGLLSRAKDEFVNYFRQRVNEELYK
ncbi:MAG: AAA family ATPase [Oscillospiraceae bacterium]|nr:AAA family ATPase [Oscillospiraceae bacterium]